MSACMQIPPEEYKKLVHVGVVGQIESEKSRLITELFALILCVPPDLKSNGQAYFAKKKSYLAVSRFSSVCRIYIRLK